MHIPSSTYRVQLHQDFTFKNLQRIIPYLETLGITTIYAAPIMQATPGSMHGYDVTDPHTINMALGTPDDLKAISRDLRKKNMHWLQDIVPNHMAFNTGNLRLMDVLERGPLSPYYHYFDINWHHHNPSLTGKVMVPFLGKELDACIKDGEVGISWTDQGFAVQYFDTYWPLSLPAYTPLMKELKNSHPDLAAGLEALLGGAKEKTLAQWSAAKQNWIASVKDQQILMKTLADMLSGVNGNSDRLKKILGTQHYVLAFWKQTDSEINYRRFFTVNELICLRMEDEQVFNEYHTYLHDLYQDKLVHGFRIDHIDGLMDPGAYTRALRKLMGEACYIIAEKILEAEEDMPAQWPIEGTSGYEFLSYLNQLLTHRKGARRLLSFYRELLPDMPSYSKLIFDSKKMILENYMRGEWENLVQYFVSLRLQGPHRQDRLKQALGFFMLALPVYRIYPESLPLKGQSLLTLHEAFEKAGETGAEYSEELSYLRNLFTLSPDDAEQGKRILSFLKRLMQFTGPLTAKGVEDTTFYIYNPLISHDEVGDAPSSLGMSIQQFHEKMTARQSASPLSLNATATHDTKRGEDARVRLNVLSRLPDQWQEHVRHWMEINARFRKNIDGRTVPATNDEYFIYQSMIGGFPEDLEVTDEWISRVKAYLNKALREAKVNTNWSAPDEAYEQACEAFIEKILQPDHTFPESFRSFLRTVLEHALVYSLSQTLLKLTAPGIPDIYQGCELWDLSFVDPDNRRPVDYEKRQEFLYQMILKEEKDREALFEYLREHRNAGIEKLYVTWKTLNFRKRHAALFAEGSYIPLPVTGKDITAAAYARNHGAAWAIVIIPLGLVTHSSAAPEDVQFIVLPENAPSRWTNLLTGEILSTPNQIALDKVFDKFPVALLTGANG